MLPGDEPEKNGDKLKQTETSEVTRDNDADDKLQTEKSDQLWASFLSDVGTRPKDGTSAAQSQMAPTVTVTAFWIFPDYRRCSHYNVYCATN